MSISIHTSYASMVAQNQLNQTNGDLNKSLERLSTGYKVNSAADDAAGLQIAKRLEAQSRGLSVAKNNALSGVAMLQTAESAFDEMTNIAFRLNDLALQASNGTNSQQDRDALNSEFVQLAQELENIFDNTNIGGRKLFEQSGDGFGAGTISFQIGTTANEVLRVDVSDDIKSVDTFVDIFKVNVDTVELQNQAESDYQADLEVQAAGSGYGSYGELKAQSVAGIGTAVADLAAVEAAAEATVDAAVAGYNAGTSGVDLATATYASISALTPGISDQNAATTLTQEISDMIDALGNVRAEFGSNINRLGHTGVNLSNISENINETMGRIINADFAKESANMSRSQMLLQSGASVLQSTKMLPQIAMSLIG